MKYVTLGMIILAMLGCKDVKSAEKIGNDGDRDVQVVIDAKRGVTCYVYSGYKNGGIFCFTKEQLESK